MGRSEQCSIDLFDDLCLQKLPIYSGNLVKDLHKQNLNKKYS